MFPNGCAICELEVDPDTGDVTITRYASVDDVGRCINPLIVHGQTHGAIVQGIGQAMWEQCYVEPDSGQPLIGSLMDYGLPRADALPSFRTEIAEVLSPTNPLGIKAGGEGGTTAAPGDDRQRDHRRAARLRRARHQDAGDPLQHLAHDQRRQGSRETREDVMPGGLTKRQMIGAIGAWAASSGVTHAQPSTKPIQIIVPFAPGASADGAARIVANELGARLGGRQIVVENKAGAGGVLGVQMLAKSAPDGDTLGVAASGALLLNSNLPKDPGPDLLRELIPVAKIIDIAIVLVANPANGPKTVMEMIERSKATPGGLTYGSTGTNSSQHLSIELFKKRTGANLVHVPYRGSAPAIIDLIGGQIPLASVDITSAYPHIQSGRAIALGVIDSKRFLVTPELPTIAEGGVPGFGRSSGFIGLFAPAGTPVPIVKKISAEVRAILATDAAKAAAKNLTAAASYQDDESFARFLAAESASWKQALASLAN